MYPAACHCPLLFKTRQIVAYSKRKLPIFMFSKSTIDVRVTIPAAITSSIGAAALPASMRRKKVLPAAQLQLHQ